MPTRKVQTRAEQMEDRWLGTGPSATSAPMPLLLVIDRPEGALLMDAPLSEAMREGFLLSENGLPAFRRSLVELGILADAVAQAALLERAAGHNWRLRQEQAREAVGALRAIVPAMANLADNIERAAEKWEDANLPERAGIADLRAIEHHGDALIALLEAVASQAMPLDGNGTKHDEREFFQAMTRWWHERAQQPTLRGGAALRNRLAAAVWRDLGGSIPDGYGSDERWAQKRFRQFGENPARQF